MRRFVGVDGTAWDVVVGRESWGTVVAIFVPLGREEAPRQALLETSSTEEGLRELQAASEEELRRWLNRSSLKPME